MKLNHTAFAWAAVSAFGASAAPETAGEAAREFCAGRIGSEQQVAAALARAKQAAALNAFVTLDESGAIAQAKQLDATPKGKGCGVLAGVPIVVKDNIEVAGLPATAGTPALKGYVPKADAPVVARLRAAGAVVLGKTNMHELAFGISGFNPAYNTGPEPGVRNAYDPTKSAGGSSSGTAAALGARVVMAGLGTDTGGSVRIPCAFNGCASLRPTVGRYPGTGIAPLSHTRDTAGPMALRMADVELLDRVVTSAPPVGLVRLERVRIGLAKEFLADMDADTRAVFDAAIGRMKAAGVTLVEVEMPGLAELNGSVSFPVVMVEARDDMVKYLRRSGSGVTIEQLAEAAASPDVKGIYQGLVIPRKLPGPNDTLVDARPAYKAAIATHRPALIKLYKETFAKNRLDAIAFPTVPKVAFAANADSSSLAVLMATIRNTDPGSNAGIPGLQMPIGLGAASGLPVGLELDGPAAGDRRLIAIGLALEALVGPLPAPPRP